MHPPREASIVTTTIPNKMIFFMAFPVPLILHFFGTLYPRLDLSFRKPLGDTLIRLFQFLADNLGLSYVFICCVYSSTSNF